MNKTIELFTSNLDKIHIGKIDSSFLDTIRILVNNQSYFLSDLAWVLPNNLGQICITPYEVRNLSEILISLKKEGFDGYISSKTSIIIYPKKSSSENTERIILHIKKLAEEARVSIRNIRKKFRQKLEDVKSFDKDLQKITDDFVKKIDNHENQFIKKVVR